MESLLSVDGGDVGSAGRRDVSVHGDRCAWVRVVVRTLRAVGDWAGGPCVRILCLYLIRIDL